MKLLLLEPDEDNYSRLFNALQEDGHSIHTWENHQDALEKLRLMNFDAAIIAHSNGDEEGDELIETARNAGIMVPILALCGSRVEDRVACLDMGADDCLAKPAVIPELLARLRALARRSGLRPHTDELTFGEIALNPACRTVKRQGRRIELQPREFSLLEQLMRHPDRVISRAHMLEHVWNFSFDPQTNIVETHMSRLRSKLNDGFGHDAIRTVRGLGYILREAG